MLMKFKVSAKSEGHTKTVVKARDFTMVIDEPPSLGGEDHGPNPVEYLLGALSGCLNVVGHIVAREMGFDFEGMEIDIEGGLDPRKFMGKPSDGRTGFQHIKVKLTLLNTEADEATLAKWLERVEDRCPVSDNIKNSTPLVIEIA